MIFISFLIYILLIFVYYFPTANFSKKAYEDSRTSLGYIPVYYETPWILIAIIVFAAISIGILILIKIDKIKEWYTINDPVSAM